MHRGIHTNFPTGGEEGWGCKCTTLLSCTLFIKQAQTMPQFRIQKTNMGLLKLFHQTKFPPPSSSNQPLPLPPLDHPFSPLNRWLPFIQGVGVKSHYSSRHPPVSTNTLLGVYRQYTPHQIYICYMYIQTICSTPDIQASFIYLYICTFKNVHLFINTP